MYCNLRPLDVAPVVVVFLGFNWDDAQNEAAYKFSNCPTSADPFQRNPTIRYKTLLAPSTNHSTLNDTEVGDYFIPTGTII